MGNRRYSEEYKREAVALTEMPGATVYGVGKELGIHPNMLSRQEEA